MIVRRKIFHVALGSVFLAFIAWTPWLKTPLLLLLFIGTLLSFAQSVMNIPVVTWILERFDRKDDTIPGEGIITFFSGVLLVWWIFPAEIALPVVAAITFGDPAASMVGNLLGGPDLPWNDQKTVSGTAIFMVASFGVVWALSGLSAAAVVAVFSSLVESLPFWRTFPFDDNIAVCGATALVLWLVLI